MSSGYSEEDIRRAAEIREWLIKEISDRQEEVERLRTTLSIIDNLLKQGSFRAAANLGIATTAATSAQAEPAATTGAAATTAAATMAQVHPQAARQTRASSSSSSATPTLRSSSSGSGIGDSDDRNIKPLKRVKDEFLLANAEISSDAVIIVPAPGINLNSNTPPFRSFFLNRILEGMKGKDSEKVNQGVLKESDALNYRVEEEGSGGGDDDNAGGSGSSSSSGGSSGIINRIVINNYRDKERLQEIFNTSTWVFTRMLEKSGKSG